jgi:KaiC/GvpD/RAD55 family RecA-like ATPase
MTYGGPGSVSTGMETLDRILDGGFPENRSVLVTGGPGTGKTTLSMQFLQEGLEHGDDCLFVSTEQRAPELRDTFQPFAFDLDHEQLTITSVHARPGRTIEGDGEQLTIETLDGDQVIGEGYSAPFSGQYVRELLERHAPADRVVIDSVSGLQAMGGDYEHFRRAVLDLVQLFSDEFEATSLFVAEETNVDTGDRGALDPLQYNTHGVVRLWLEEVRSDLHRFLQVRKLRGRNHDTRPYEIEFSEAGVHVIPRNRNGRGSDDREFVDTRIEGLDALCGGGLLRESSVVFEHDGQADLEPLFVALFRELFATDASVLLLVPEVSANPEVLNRLFPERDDDPVGTLLDDDQLFVIDMTNSHGGEHENIFAANDRDGGVQYLLQLIDDRRGDRPLSTFIDTETAVRTFGADDLVGLHRWQETHLLDDGGVTVYVHNPGTVPGEIENFFANNAAQVLETWRHDTGLQYLSLNKSPTGYVGSSRLVESIESYPFVRIQSPPGPTVDAANGGDGA